MQKLINTGFALMREPYYTQSHRCLLPLLSLLAATPLWLGALMPGLSKVTIPLSVFAYIQQFHTKAIASPPYGNFVLLVVHEFAWTD